MSEFHIPQTIQEVSDRLSGIDRLLTAGEWERAAIVYAFTQDDVKANQYARSETTTGMSPREFASLGIRGLKSDSTVRVYRKAWQSAIDEGKAKPVEPGDTVDIPEMQWPPTDSRVGNYGRRIESGVMSAPAEQKAEIFARLANDPEVQASPSFARTVVERVASHPSLTAQVNSRAQEVRPAPEPVRREPNTFDALASLGVGAKWYSHSAKDAAERVNRLVTYVRANRDTLSDSMREAVRQDIEDLRSASEIYRRFAAEIELAMGGQDSDAWLRSILSEV